MSPYLVEQELESVWLSNVDAEKETLITTTVPSTLKHLAIFLSNPKMMIFYKKILINWHIVSYFLKDVLSVNYMKCNKKGSLIKDMDVYRDTKDSSLNMETNIRRKPAYNMWKA